MSIFKLNSKICLLAVAGAFPAVAQAEVLTGDYSMDLNTIYATLNTGSPAPEGDAFCEEKFGQHKGSSLSGSYDINTTSLIMSITAEFLGESIKTAAMGLSGRYAFISIEIPQTLKDMDVDRVIVNLSKPDPVSDPEGDVMFVPGGEYNCILSNMAAN